MHHVSAHTTFGAWWTQPAAAVVFPTGYVAGILSVQCILAPQSCSIVHVVATHTPYRRWAASCSWIVPARPGDQLTTCSTPTRNAIINRAKRVVRGPLATSALPSDSSRRCSWGCDRRRHFLLHARHLMLIPETNVSVQPARDATRIATDLTIAIHRAGNTNVAHIEPSRIETSGCYLISTNAIIGRTTSRCPPCPVSASRSTRPDSCSPLIVLLKTSWDIGCHRPDTSGCTC
uniref:Uncharacterized protein n=1 Tax=Anopheles christyi TaxID=43041 RepID=A0A182KHP2_9DIPT